MSTTLTQLRLEVQSIAPWIFPVISTVSGTSTTAYLTDVYKWTDTTTNGSYLNAKTATGAWIFRPSATTTERERRVGSDTPVDLTNGRIAHGGPVWTGAPSAADAYEIHALQPTLTFNMLVAALGRLLVSTLQPIPMFTDADMETAGVTNWTASNLTGGSSIKTTTAARVYSGTQSLRVLLSGANGYYRSATINTEPGVQYFISVPIQVATGGPFYLRATDAASATTIATSTGSSLLRYMSVQLQFTASSSRTAIDLLGTANLDDAYFGPVSGPLKSDDLAPILMPSWLQHETWLQKIMSAEYKLGYQGQVYDAYSRSFMTPYQKGRDYELRINASAANPYILEWRTRPEFGYELWMEALRPASDVYTLANTSAGESAPVINLDKRMLALIWARAISDAVLVNKPNDTEAAATKTFIDGPKGKVGPLASLLKDYERDLVTVEQKPVVLPTYRSWM